MLGSRSHGWGSHKKHRGGGHRGGRGNAGSGKRGDSKKPSIWKTVHQDYGKHGFLKKGQVDVDSTVNFWYFEEKFVRLLSEKKITKVGDHYQCDLSALGFTKLLGTGTLSHKIHFIVEKCPERVVSKAKSMGCQVTVGKASVSVDEK